MIAKVHAISEQTDYPGHGDLADQSVFNHDRDVQVGVAAILRNNELEASRGPSTGFCRDCGDPISEARLKALPYAVQCKDCKEKAECGALN